jgi:S-adenosylmethionine-diacylglycerol 3-amino-3-carboxypropyl transferase
MSPEFQSFWDSRLDVLDSGIAHSGRLELYWGLWRKYILPLTHSQSAVKSYLAGTSQFESGPIFNQLFKVYFGKTMLGLLGRDPAFFKHVTIDVGGSLLQRLMNSINTLPVKQNFYVEYILTGTYSGNNGLPPYLVESNYATLRERVDRIELVEGDLRAYLANPISTVNSEVIHKFDSYNLSDCFEWMDEAMTESTLRVICGSATPGARLAYWNLLVWRESPEPLRGEVLVSDKAKAQSLHKVDRTFFYRNFEVERTL